MLWMEDLLLQSGPGQSLVRWLWPFLELDSCADCDFQVTALELSSTTPPEEQYRY